MTERTETTDWRRNIVWPIMFYGVVAISLVEIAMVVDGVYRSLTNGH